MNITDKQRTLKTTQPTAVATPLRGLPGFAAASGLNALHYVAILPPETTCVDRVTTRTGHGFTSAEATRTMHRDFTQATLSEWHLITGTEKGPQEIAREIVDRVAAGSLLWRAPGSMPAPETT